jgi:hypothetical protein
LLDGTHYPGLATLADPIPLQHLHRRGKIPCQPQLNRTRYRHNSIFNQKETDMKAHIVLTAAILAAFAANAMADEATFDANHPRRAQVNSRLANQNARINAKEASGQMTQAQGNKIKAQDHQIRQEERAMASQNGGHITKQEQRTLNAQENHTSQEIRNK